MVKGVFVVSVRMKRGTSVYLSSPLELLDRFRNEVERVLSSLDKKRKANRVLRELLEEEGWIFEVLEKVMERLEREGGIVARKRVCDAFYRIFRRLEWAKESGSEKEIELRGWILSSLDFLFEEFVDGEGKE